MAKFNLGQLIKKGDAKQRVLFILAAVLVLVLIVFLLSKVLNFGSNSAGNSQVSNVPGIASVQGGKVSPEYERALNSNNVQQANYARSTGTSAIPTIINTGETDLGSTVGCTECCNSCGSESTNQLLSTMLSSGKISSSTADLLNSLANQNLSPEDYEAELARLVREGKISPEEARKLLAAYKQRYQEKMGAVGAQDLDPLIKQGVLSVGAASALLDLQKQPASLAAYNQALQNLVNNGQLSADAAKLLQQKYQQQQEKRLSDETAGQLTSMEADGSLSHDTASMLQALQASGLSSSDYAAALDKMVKDGKLSPELAKRLLGQYNKQHGGSNITSEDMALSGMELSREQGDALKALQKANATVDAFAAKLEAYARADEISTDTAGRLLTAYQAEYNAKQVFFTALNQAVTQNQVSSDMSAKIQALASNNAPLDQFTTALNAFSTQGLLAAPQVTVLVNVYAKVKTAADAKDQLITQLESKAKLPTDVAQQLAGLRDKSISLGDYASELQRLVDAGLISPETAKALLDAYKKRLAQGSGFANGNGAAFAGLSSPALDVNLTSSGNANLDRIAQTNTSQQAAAQQRRDYTAAAAFQQQNQQAMMNQQNQIQQLSDKMYAQAQQLFASTLSPPAQTVVVGEVSAAANDGASAASSSLDTIQNAANSIPLVKAGTVLYGVLDTAVDSDYPDTPVMATIVAGQFKGAKLLGSIKTVKNGQRVMLTFNLMTMDAWPKGTAINAFAIDPDSARAAVATSVDNHYMLRYGTAFAASFLQGLGQAVQESGTSVSSDSGVVTQSTSNLNTEETILVALGQVGQNASGEVARLQNTPPTVKVKAGVSVGILFMSDVSAVEGSGSAPSTPSAQPSVQTMQSGQ